jgi:hypothetical protein
MQIQSLLTILFNLIINVIAFRKRKESKEMRKARKRSDGINSIGENVDLGNGLTAEAYSAEIEKVAAQTADYNTLLSTLDGKLTELVNAEKALAELSTRMLNAVGTKYGYDSVEYEKAGGTRKSERKRPAKKNNGNGKTA